jgi:hypothetical protein
MNLPLPLCFHHAWRVQLFQLHLPRRHPLLMGVLQVRVEHFPVELNAVPRERLLQRLLGLGRNQP